ncbi:MAG: choice-of-anchor D domain-containing protein [Planctomycetes bacterium]|nr:choice-of-anchor D domain-containing protein [Planctomycetota bacterium]
MRRFPLAAAILFAAIFGGSLAAQVTFTDTPGAAVTIPDGNRNGLSRTINIGATTDRIGQFRLDIRLNHNTDSDIDIYLIPPWVTWTGPYTLVSNEFSTPAEHFNAPYPSGVIEVSTDNGGTGNNYGSTAGGGTYARFSAAGDPTNPATQAITAGTVPYTANVYTVEGLDAMKDIYGRNPTGTWTLVMADDTAGTTGTFVSWRITYTNIGASRLYAHPGAANDRGAPIARGTPNQVLGQFRLEDTTAATTVTSMTFRESAGTNLNGLVSSVSLYADNDGDGALDGTDTLLGTQATAASPTVAIAINQAIAANGAVDLLLVGTTIGAPAPVSMQMEIQNATAMTSSLTEDGQFPVQAGPRPFVTTTTFTSRPNGAVLIPDNTDSGVTNTITVPSTTDRINSLRVGVRVNGSYDADLDMYLLPPGVTWSPPYATPNNGPVLTAPTEAIELCTDNGAGGNNFGSDITAAPMNYTWNYTRFSGTNDPNWPAATAITAGAAPFTAAAQYRPEGLTAWNLNYGGNPSGNWTLIVVDAWGQDVSYLISWQLEYVPITGTQFWANVGNFNEPGTPATVGTAGNVFGQLELASYNGANTVTQIVVRETNGLTIGNNLSAISLYRDVNGDGVLDVGDTLVGNGVLAGSTATFNISFNIASNTTEFLLIVGTVLASPANASIALQLTTNADITGSTSEIAPYPLQFGAHPLNPIGTYVSTPSGGKNIPDNNANGITDTITIPPTNDVIGALRVGFRIDHARDQDLDIWLIPPGVTWAGPYTTANNGANPTPPAGVIELSTDNGANGVNYGSGSITFVYTMLSRNGDRQFSATNAITGGTAPFTAGNNYIEEDTADFNARYGTSPVGNWTIAIGDDQNGSTGRLISWFVQYIPGERVQIASTPVAGVSDFGSIAVGSSSAAQGFLGRNAGNFNLTIPAPTAVNGIRITGTNAADFVIQGTAPSGLLTPGATTATFNIIFTPSGTGLRTANITVTWNTSDATMPAQLTSNYAITGTGVSRILEVRETDAVSGALVANGAAAANGRAFGNRDITAGASAALTIYVKNTGTAVMTVGVPTLGGANPGEFVLNTTGYLTSIPAGSNTSFTVAFDPTSTGAKAATISFTHNAGNTASPFTCAVSGTGVSNDVTARESDPTTGIIVTNNQAAANGRAFGNQSIGAGPTAALTVYIVNTGTQALTLGTPTIGGADAGQFVLDTTGFSTNIAAGANTSFTVAFDPSTTGLKNATISFTHTATNTSSPFAVNVNGTGTASAQVEVRETAVGGTLVANGAAAANGRAFGNRDIGAGVSATLTIFVLNTGGVNLTPGTPTLGGTNPGEFVLNTAGFAASIAPGGNSTFTIAFDPSTVGAKVATVSFTHNGTNTASPFTFDVSGTGITPTVEVRETAVGGTLVSNGAAAANGRAFGNRDIAAGPTANLTIFVLNTGSNTMTLTAPTLGGVDAGQFNINTAGFSTSLAAGANTTFTVNFDPSTVGAKTATVSFTHNGTNTASPFTFDLSGTGTTPTVEVREAAVGGTLVSNGAAAANGRAFGNRDISAGASATLTIFVLNTGTATMTLVAPTLGGADPGEFVLNTAGFSTSVAAGANTTFTVAFDPTSVGAKAATISFTHTGSNTATPFTFGVSGTGISPFVEVRETAVGGTLVANGAAAANGRAFGSRDISAGPTAALTIFVLNTGTNTMTLTAPTLGGADAGQFVLNTTGFSLSVAAGANTTFTVAFDPSTAGAKIANVSFTHNGTNTATPFTFDVSGTGITPTVEVRETAVGGTLVANGAAAANGRAFGNRDISAGPTATLTIFVLNTGSNTMTLTAPTLGGADAGQFVLDTTGFSTSLATGANTTFTLAFDPSTVGAKVATVSFTHNGTNTATPFTFDLSGTGITPGVEVRETAVGGTLVANGAAAANGRAFGNRDINAGPSATLTIFVLNTGSNTLSLAAPTLGGADAGQFVLDTTGFSTSLAAGANTTFTLAFDPSTVGAKTATVSFTHDGTNTASPFTFDVSGTGITPTVEVRETAVGGTLVANGAAAANGRAFGNRDISAGPSATLTIFVLNTGSNTITLTAPSLGGADAGQFVLDTTGFSTSVAAGANTNFTVAFDPTTAGAKTATVSFTHNGTNTASPFTFDVSGTGITPTVEVRETAVGGTLVANGAAAANGRAFGNRDISAGPTAALTIFVLNTGSNTMTLAAPTLGGADAGQFVLDTTGFSTSVAAGANTSFTVAFDPTTAGAKTATVSFTHNGTNTASPFTFDVSGTGITPTVEVRETAVGGTLVANGAAAANGRAFGNRDISAGPSATLTVFVLNTGSNTMTLAAPTLGGADAGQFVLDTTGFSTSLAVGANTTFSLAFDPSTVGSKTATVSFAHNGTNTGSPFTFDVSGTGITPTVEVRETAVGGTLVANGAAAANGRAFGNRDISAGSSAALTIFVLNTGSNTITLGTPTIGGADAGQFVLNTGGFSGSVAAGGNTTFTVAFDPSTVGAKTATISFTHNGTNTASPFTFDVSGTGITPTVEVRETAVGGTLVANGAAAANGRAFGNRDISAGPTATLAIFVLNTGTNTITLAAPTLGGADAGQFVLDSSSFSTSVAAGANTSFTVAFDPTTVGAKTASVSFTHDATNTASPFTFDVSGTGITPTVEVRETAVGGTLVANGAAAANGRAFGSRDISAGPTATLTIFVLNTGTNTITLGTPILGGADAGQFVLDTSSFSASVAAGANTTFTVAFDPSTVGAKTATVSFTHNGTNTASPFTFDVSGTGITPTVEVRETAVGGTLVANGAAAANGRAFGNRDISAGPSATLTIFVLNTGSNTITLGTPTIGGADAGEFVLNTGGFSGSVAAGANTSFTVAFDPSTAGPKTATISFTHNGTNTASPFTFDVSGTGITPTVEVRETAVGGTLVSNGAAAANGRAFGNRDISAGASATLAIFVLNTGSNTVTLGTPALGGVDAGQFVINTGGFSGSVAAGANTSFTVAFDPSTVGAKTATVSFTHDGTNTASPFTFDVSGTGITPTVEVRETAVGGTLVANGAAAANGRAFGNQDISSGATATLTIFVLNTGSNTITLGTPALGGADAGQFVLNTGGFSGSVAAGANTTFTVAFDPSTTGLKAATVSFTHDGTNTASPFTFDLSGTGTTPLIEVREADAVTGVLISNGLAAAGTARDFGDQNVSGGATAALTIYINNTGTHTMTVAAPTLSAGDTGDFVLDTTGFSTSVAPGANTSFTVAFDPASTGGKAATVSFTHNATNDATPFDFEVVGNGTNPPVIDISGSAAFGSVDLGQSSAAHLITITNTGGTDLTVTAVALAGANPGDWSLSPVSPASFPGAAWTIAPAATATFNATFTPTAGGARSANIAVTSDTGGTPGTVTNFAITGTGVFPVALSAALISGDTGGPQVIRVTVTGTFNTISDLLLEYQGGSVGAGWSNSGVITRVSDSGATISGNLIEDLNAPTAGSTIDILWDAYATERHVTAANYVVRLTPVTGMGSGTSISVGPFTLTRDGGWAQHVEPGGNITGRFGHTTIYQTSGSADRMIVFGGKVGSTLINDVWAYDRGSFEPGWRQVRPTGTAPTIRQYHSAIYDSANNRMIVFSGKSGPTLYNDVWSLSLTPGSEAWTQLTPGGTAPAIRYSAMMGYDAARGRAIVYGGWGAVAYADVFALDLTPGAEAWSTITAGGTAPQARMGAAVALQPAPADRLVIYGGYTSSGASSSEIFRLSLAPGSETWASITAAGGAGGSTRYYTSHVYDPVRNALMMSSGYRGSTVLKDAWMLSLGAGSETWTALPEDGGASDGRVVGAAAYDSGRSEAMFFGGLGVAGFGVTGLVTLPSSGSPTWVLPATGATQAMPNGRWGAGMIYDAANSRTVIFGGKDSVNRYNDVWAVNPAAASPVWSKLATSGTAPTPRVYAQVVYDSNSQRMIVFGGQTASGGSVNDLWELDLSTLAWQQLTPAGGPPTARQSAAVCYDATPGAERLLMHGGNTNSGLNGESWVLDLSTRYSEAWTQLNPGAGPAARQGHGAVYNSVLQQFVIFMGSTGTRKDDVWAMDLSGGIGTESWIDITPAAGPPAPSARYLFGYASDAAGLTVFVQGGDAGSLMNDLWILDLSGFAAVWTPVIVSGGVAPLHRSVHSACYDDANNRLVIGMGLTLWPCADIWTILPFAGSPVWSEVHAASAPAAMVNGATCYDPVFKRMIAFGGIASGGFDSQLWQLDLTTPVATWSKLATAGTLPAGRRGASLVFDSVAGTPRMIMYGGWLGTANSTITNQVWQLSLAAGTGTWTNITPAPAGGQPGGRANHAAVFDATGNRMVIFGGQTSAAFVNTVYALSLGGSPAWSLQATSGTAPSIRMGMSYSFHPSTRRLVIMGGYNGSTTFSDMFYLNLATNAWSSQGGAIPPKRYYNSMVYDAANDRMVMYGGFDTAALSDLWSFSFASSTWTQITPTVALPQTRWAHAAIWDVDGARMVVSGGYVDGENASVQIDNMAQLWFWGD